MHLPRSQPTPKTTFGIPRKAYKRLRKLSTGEILDWADTAGSGIAKALMDYRKTGGLDPLNEAEMGLETLLASTQVLKEREERLSAQG